MIGDPAGVGRGTWQWNGSVLLRVANTGRQNTLGGSGNHAFFSGAVSHLEAATAECAEPRGHARPERDRRVDVPLRFTLLAARSGDVAKVA